MKSQKSKLSLEDGRPRCGWASQDLMLARYHDREWGRSIRTNHGHLERMALEIFQCGLSWKIVLVKRPALQRCFDGFDVDKVAQFSGTTVDRLCEDPSIIRNRRKIEATIRNAQVFKQIIAEHGSYCRWFNPLPADSTDDVQSLFKLFQDKFKFMGPETTKCYLMGCGKLSPDHEVGCWLHASA